MATATTKTTTKPAAKTEDKAPRTRYNWTDDLKKEIADKLGAAPRGGQQEILDHYSEQTGVQPASIYAVVQSFRNKGKSGRGKRSMSAVDRLSALKAEQEAVLGQAVTELRAERAEAMARIEAIEAELTSFDVTDFDVQPEGDEDSAEA